MRASTALRRLEALRNVVGAGARKLELLRLLERGRLGRAREVLRLHEALLALRAFPDDLAVLEAAEHLLARFARRGDLRRHRRALIGSGIAGTEIATAFYWPTAQWLSRCFPGHLHVDWDDFENEERLEELLALLFPYAETLALEDLYHSAREWIAMLKGPAETDADFLVCRFEVLDVPHALREHLYDDLDVPLRLEPGPGTPALTTDRYEHASFGPHRAGAQRRHRVRRILAGGTVEMRPVRPRDADRLIALARSMMIARQRDLHGFMYASREDVTLADAGDGLQLACMGLVPEHRYVLESLYTMLLLRNGVPLGYMQASALFNSAEIGYTLFDTFRGFEVSRIYVAGLAAARCLLGAGAFGICTQQIDNPDALASGAWWFYYKHGFRPRDSGARAVMRSELAALRRDPRHRSSRATLAALGEAPLFRFLDGPRDDVITAVPVGEIGLAVSRYLAGRFGAGREQGLRTCMRETAALLGLRSLRSLGAGERVAFECWAPLILRLPGVRRWSTGARRELLGVVRAKGGRRESEFVRRFDAHRPLRRAVLRLAREEAPLAARDAREGTD